MRCVVRLNELKPRRRYQYIQDLKALAADGARPTNDSSLPPCFLFREAKTNETRTLRQSVVVFLVYGVWGFPTPRDERREQARAGERESAAWALQRSWGWKVGGLVGIRGVIPVPKVSLQLDSTANCYLNR